MLIAFLILFFPIIIFLATLPISKKLNPRLAKLYRIIAGFIVIVGSGISVYFAAYTGEQGGVAALYFQIAVIATYLIFSIGLVIFNFMSRHNEQLE